MAKLLVLYHPPVDPAAFDAHYRDRHIPLAKKVPGLRSFEMSTGEVSMEGPDRIHLVALLTFDSLQDLQAGLGSPEGQAAIGDLGNFAGGGTTIMTFQEQKL